MADSGKTKTPETKKAHEGGKKRRKHKKLTEAAGDGAPSPVSAASTQASASSPQTRPEGATASVKEDQGDKTQGKGTAKQEDNRKDDKIQSKGAAKQEVNQLHGKDAAKREDTVSEPAGAFSQNNTSSERKTSETPSKSSQNHGDKERKGTPKEVGKEVGEPTTQKNTPKPEDKERKDGDLSRKDTPKLAGKDSKDNELPKAGLQTQSGKEKKDSETHGKGGAQQKGNTHEKSEQTKKDKPDSNKVQDSADGQQKAKTKAKADVEKTDVVDGQQRSKTRAEPMKKSEVIDGEQKSKAQLRAERRAVQEAQRAAKDVKKGEPAGGSSARATSSANAVTVKIESVGDKSRPPAEVTSGEKNSKKKMAVNAAVLNETEEQMWARKEKEMLGKSLKIDNSILNLGFQYFHHHIVGANARCMALLATLKEVITKYRTPDEKELSRDLEKNFLNPCISYLNYCRPISTSMGNAIRHLKYHISKIPSDMEDETAISRLHDVIDSFIQVNIIKAAEAVAHYANTKIDNGDVILVYAASSLIGQVLKTAFNQGKRFHVIVVEGRPRSEGKSMLKFLVRCGIPCSYIYIGSASHAMSEATKVFLGAAAMFAIGDMYSRSGNSMIAALAKTNNIPVLVCCESYKFTDKVQLHTGDSNLHTRGKDLVTIGHRTPIVANYEEIGLGLLNLMYDVTGSEYITAVVTELGMLPCTSVPVVLRRQEDLY